MGSFDVTCAVSGLPIEGGTAVRYLLLSQGPYYRAGDFTVGPDVEWFPLTPPMSTHYYDYGRVDDLAPRFMAKAWRAQLRECLVSMPVGENSCHDVAVHRGSKLSAMIEASTEGRLRVRRVPSRMCGDLDAMISEMRALRGEPVPPRPPNEPKGPPAGVPTWRRIARVLREAGIADHRAYALGYARVKVARNGYGEGTVSDAVVAAIAAAGYAIGVHDDGPYEKGVTVLPMDYRSAVADHAERMNARKRIDVNPPLAVAGAMVRADVWASMVGDPIVGATEELIDAMGFGGFRSSLDGPPFCASGADTFRVARGMVDRGEATPDEWDAFVRACVELVRVRRSLMLIKQEWRPSAYGGQMHAWSEHARILSTWAQIARDEAAAEAKRNAEDDE